MNTADFHTIEHHLCITLPTCYRSVMAAYPFPEQSRPAQFCVPDNPIAVQRLNENLRVDPEHVGLWRSYYFAVGTTYGGDAYFLDSRQGDSPVFRVSGSDHSISEVAADLDVWIAQLQEWYVDFDDDIAGKLYADLKAAIAEAGFFSSRVEPMAGWHRIVIASERFPQGGLTGNSFWVAPIDGAWFAGTWGGHVYKVPGDIADFCVTWLNRAPDGTSADFDDEVRTKFNLQLLSDGESDALIPAD